MSSILFVKCDKKEDEMTVSGVFTVTIENVMEESSFFASGVFNTPVEASVVRISPLGKARSSVMEFPAGNFSAGIFIVIICIASAGDL